MSAALAETVVKIHLGGLAYGKAGINTYPCILLSSFWTGRICDGQVGTELCAASCGLNSHSSWTGSSGDDDDLSLEGEELLERFGFGDGDRHDGGLCMLWCEGIDGKVLRWEEEGVYIWGVGCGIREEKAIASIGGRQFM